MSITDIGAQSLDSFFTAVIKNYHSDQTDNWVKDRPAIQHFMESASMRDEGGYLVSYPEAYGTNTTTVFFDGMDRIDTTPQETNLPSQYYWKNIYSAVAIAETDMMANRGKAAIFDLFKARIKQSEKSVRDLINQEFYGDGTNFNFKTFVGVGAGVSATPTADPASGAVGGIPASNTWWQNVQTTLGSWAANGVNGTATDSVFATYNTCTDGNETYPTIILSDQATYQYYNQSLVKNERIVVNGSSQTLNMATLVYGPKNTPWYWDRQCPTGYMYLLNKEDMGFVVDPGWYFTWGPPKSWPDQLAVIRIVKLRFFMKYTRRMFLGVISGITA